MGFSPLGLIVSIAVLAPNVVLLWFPPRDQAPSAVVPRPLAWLERAGQALCLVVPAITHPGTIQWWWMLPGVGALLSYAMLWRRYLVAGRLHHLLYDSWGPVPVPMAVLPVAVFLSAAAWLSNPSIALAALVLAGGHIPVSVIIRTSLSPAR